MSQWYCLCLVTMWLQIWPFQSSTAQVVHFLTTLQSMWWVCTPPMSSCREGSKLFLQLQNDGRLLLPAMKTQLAAAQCHLQSMCQLGTKGPCSKASAGTHIISKSGLDKLSSSFAACAFMLQPWEVTVVVLPHITQVLRSNLFQYASVVHFKILNIGCVSFCCLVFSFMRKAWRQYASHTSHFCWHVGQPMKFWMHCSLTSSVKLCDGSVQIWWIELHNRQGLKQFHNRAKGKHYLTGQGNAWKQFAS